MIDNNDHQYTLLYQGIDQHSYNFKNQIGYIFTLESNISITTSLLPLTITIQTLLTQHDQQYHNQVILKDIIKIVIIHFVELDNIL